MVVIKTLKDVVQYLTEGFLRIFSPIDDEYPAIGIQPFYGDISYYNS